MLSNKPDARGHPVCNVVCIYFYTKLDTYSLFDLFYGPPSLQFGHIIDNSNFEVFSTSCWDNLWRLKICWVRCLVEKQVARKTEADIVKLGKNIFRAIIWILFLFKLFNMTETST